MPSRASASPTTCSVRPHLHDTNRCLPHALQTWFRCWVLCMALYFGVGAIWAYYAYFAFGEARPDGCWQYCMWGSASALAAQLLWLEHRPPTLAAIGVSAPTPLVRLRRACMCGCAGDRLFKPGDIPTRQDIWEQMKVCSPQFCCCHCWRSGARSLEFLLYTVGSMTAQGTTIQTSLAHLVPWHAYFLYARLHLAQATAHRAQLCCGMCTHGAGTAAECTVC